MILLLFINLVLLSPSAESRYVRTDPNAIHVIGTPNPNMTYDEVLSGYLGLDALEKQAFKMQIGYMEDVSYIVYVTKTGTKFHRFNCRYNTVTSQPVLRSTVESKYDACGVCRP